MKGFSLVEFLIANFLALIFSTSILLTFLSQQQLFLHIDQWAQAQESARAVFTLLSDEIRQAADIEILPKKIILTIAKQTHSYFVANGAFYGKINHEPRFELINGVQQFNVKTINDSNKL